MFAFFIYYYSFHLKTPKTFDGQQKYVFFTLSWSCVLVFMHVSHSQSRIHKRLIVNFLFVKHNTKKTEKMRRKRNNCSYLPILYICFLHTVRRIRDYYTENIFTLRPTNERQKFFLKETNCLLTFEMFFFFSLLNPIEFVLSSFLRIKNRLTETCKLKWSFKNQIKLFRFCRYSILWQTQTLMTLRCEYILIFFVGFYQLPTVWRHC